MNSTKSNNGKRKFHTRYVIIAFLFTFIFIGSAYVYSRPAIFIMAFGRMFGVEEFILPVPLDYQVIKTIGNVEYVRRLDDGRNYFKHSEHTFVINSYTISYITNKTNIYIHAKQNGGSISIQDGISYYSLTYFNNGGYHTKNYTKIEEMPTFAKVDSETGDTWWYQNFDEMSNEDRIIFQGLLQKEEENETMEKTENKEEKIKKPTEPILL